jgi:hypothetical protein
LVVQRGRGGGVSHTQSFYGGRESVEKTIRAKAPENFTITKDIIAKIPRTFNQAKMPEESCYTGLSGQDDLLING